MIPFILALLLIPSLLFAGDLQTITFNTGAYRCGYKHVNIHEQLWTNEGPAIRVKGSLIWMGADRGADGDMQATLHRVSTATVINSFGYDRYRNPGGPHQVVKEFGEDWITIGTGDSISLQYFCNMSPKEVYGHVVATIWYLTLP